MGVPAVVLNELGELVDQATHVSMTQSFVSSLPIISDAGSGRLELASVERQEILRDEDTLMISGGPLIPWDLGRRNQGASHLSLLCLPR